MIKCDACGENNFFDGAAFCRKCGTSLTRTRSQKAEAQAKSDQGQAESRDIQGVTGNDPAVLATRPQPDSASESPTSDFEIENEFDSQAGSSEQRAMSESTEPSDRQRNVPLSESGVALSQQSAEPVGSDTSSESKESFSSLQEIELPDVEPVIEAAMNRDREARRADESPSQSDADVLAQNDRDKLISDLEAKIPSVIQQSHPTSEPEIAEVSDAAPAFEATMPVWNSEFGSQPTVSETDSVIQSSGLSHPDAVDDSQTDTTHAAAPEKSNRNRVAAYFKGSRIQFPSGTTFKAGEEVSLRNKTFILKQSKRDLKTIGLYAALGFVVFLLALVQIGRSRSGNYLAPLTGVVVDSNTLQVLSDVKVTISELGKSVSTDKNGMFSFEMVPSGYYTVTAETPFFSPSSVTVSHGSSQSVVGLAVAGAGQNLYEETSVASNPVPQKQEEQDPTPVGAIKVTTNVEQAEVYIDKKKKGVGSRKFSNLSEGLHTVIVKFDGYHPFEQSVSVTAGKTAAVSAELIKVAAEPPAEPTASEYADAGAKAAASGDWTSSVEQYTLALAKEKRPEFCIKRGEAQLNTGRKEDARKDFMTGANLYRSAGQATAAIQAYSQALALFPNDMAILRARGYACIDGGDYEGGLRDFQAASSLDENSYANQIGLGDAYSVLGNHKEAIKAYEKAEKLTDKKADVYALLALANLSRGKDKDARKYYKKFQEAASPDQEQRYLSDPDWQRLKALASRD